MNIETRCFLDGIRRLTPSSRTNPGSAMLSSPERRTKNYVRLSEHVDHRGISSEHLDIVQDSTASRSMWGHEVGRKLMFGVSE
jgi:hypothetical protein